MSGALDIGRAVQRVAEGRLIAYPTETVWALGADARSEPASVRARAWKGRSAARPFSVLVPGPEALEDLGAELSPRVRRLAESFWPGPLTLVLRCRTRLASGVARADGAVGFRCSPHPVARALAVEAARRGVGPLTATSLNRSGDPPCRTRREAEALCEGEDAPGVVEGVDAGGAAESSVLDLTGCEAVLLRVGALASEAIHSVLQQGGEP